MIWENEYQFCRHIFGSYAAIGGLINMGIYINEPKTDVNKSLNSFFSNIPKLDFSLFSLFDKKSTTLRPEEFSLITASIWIGVLLAISGMEAWVKFKAPYVKKELKFDIGRFVFSAANSIEAGLCLTLLTTNFLFKRRSGLYRYSASLCSICLLLQITIITPKLLEVAKIKVTNSLKEEEVEDKDKNYLKLKVDAENSKNTHLQYVVLEGIKLICLGSYIFY